MFADPQRFDDSHLDLLLEWCPLRPCVAARRRGAPQHRRRLAPQTVL